MWIAAEAAVSIVSPVELALSWKTYDGEIDEAGDGLIQEPFIPGARAWSGLW